MTEKVKNTVLNILIGLTALVGYFGFATLVGFLTFVVNEDATIAAVAGGLVLAAPAIAVLLYGIGFAVRVALGWKPSPTWTP